MHFHRTAHFFFSIYNSVRQYFSSPSPISIISIPFLYKYILPVPIHCCIHRSIQNLKIHSHKNKFLISNFQHKLKFTNNKNMASRSSSYYHQYPTNNYHYSTFNYLTDLPLHLCLFLLTLFLFLAFSFYMNLESASESLADQGKLFLILTPILLVLAVQCLSNFDTQHLSLSLLVPEQNSIHRAGSSPWGVAMVLVILLLMVSYQSSFHEMWFPFGR